MADEDRVLGRFQREGGGKSRSGLYYMKERLDVILVNQGYAPSREKAKAIIMSGNVYVDGQREDKAGTAFDEGKIRLEVRGSTLKYVSRGGLKLEKAMDGIRDKFGRDAIAPASTVHRDRAEVKAEQRLPPVD